ncbi:sulfur carrier protein ThiS [Egicoccus sp. AB-alg2]|uniref:sulfur carrier protein ThiS n=1 Tax=Egicoccus sp. AB-alg2 TaxID=3242693 RepID=UPI00359EC141
MNVHVNGHTRTLTPGTTLGQLVDGQVPDRRGVAVAVDGEVVPRRDWDATALDDGAHIELVGAVQGG